MSIPLYDILHMKYPNANFMQDIILVDLKDGLGSRIGVWNLPTPQPTQEMLDQWQIDLAKDYQFNLNRIANAPIYAELADIDLRSIRALRTNDNDRLHELEEMAISLRTELLPVQ